MPSGDGLIVRLKLTGGIVDIGLARRIAAWSSRWGNGQIDLSNRANLQLRGLRAEHLRDLHSAMAVEGLLDGSEAGEAVRNVIASPLAGLDPDAALDIRPVVRSLEQRLARDVFLRALPGKFGFAIDDGGRFGLDDVPADIRFVARQGPAFTIHLGGAEPTRLGPVSPEAVSDVAASLAGIFMQHAGVRRMRDLVAVRGSEAIGREAGLDPLPTLRPARRPRPFLGARVLGSAGLLGVGLPFGRMAAEDLAALAGAAAAIGAEDLRLTPWRAILLPAASVGAAAALAATLPADAFILDPDDPRRRIAACPGAPSCDWARGAVRQDAAVLAGAIGKAAITVHVSGCEKGCAHPAAAPVTLIARNGRYDLVCNGNASSVPALRDLTLAQVAERLR
jgi:precorrin-3B synthase